MRTFALFRAKGRYGFSNMIYSILFPISYLSTCLCCFNLLHFLVEIWRLICRCFCRQPSRLDFRLKLSRFCNQRSSAHYPRTRKSPAKLRLLLPSRGPRCRRERWFFVARCGVRWSRHYLQLFHFAFL